MEDKGLINIRYFDESGFSLSPCVPYGWQPIGSTRRINCQRSKRQNVLGFMGRNGKLNYVVTEEKVNAEMVIDVFDTFAKEYYQTEFLKTGKLCFVIIDNATMHHAKRFHRSISKWLIKGLVVRHIPAYSPELNLIEILWRKIKYEWLPLSAFLNIENLKSSLQTILSGFGQKYQITFA